MAGTEAIFGELMALLSEEERQALPKLPVVSCWFPRHDPTDPWNQFAATFGHWGGQRPELRARLLPPFAAWLEDRGDVRGELVRSHLALAERRWEPSSRAQEIEFVFLRDIIARPADEHPFLVFADWLEENGDPRAEPARLIARGRALSRSVDPWWVEDFFPRALRIGFGPVSDTLRRAVQSASQEAQRLNHLLVSTHHALLALLREDFGLATGALTALGLDRKAVGAEVERLTAPGDTDFVVMGKLPQSARLRAASRFTFQESLGDETADPVHLLLGLCRAAPCAATRVMVSLGVAPALVCERVLKGMGHDPWPWLRAHPEVW